MNHFFRNRFITFLVAVSCLATAANVKAGGLTTLIKEGAEIVSKRLGSAAARDTAEGVAEQVAKEGAESVARRSAAKLVEESAEQLARRSGIIASRCTSDAARAALRYGEPAAGLINTFGDDAAQALVKVTSRNGRRLILLEKELAQSGKAAPLLKLVESKGDSVVEWLWNNKATVAAGVGATVLLTHPDAVLGSGASVATAAINAVGTGVVRPITEGLAWIVSRLSLLAAITAAATYGVWLKFPSLRPAINALVHKGISEVRRKPR
jgi:hypothetical protein